MINLYDRIKEITYTIGTNDLSLSGAVNGFSTFSSVYSNNEELFYTITDGVRYEIGSGLYLSVTNSIKRFPVKSTNNNQLVNFPEGLKEVFVNYPATNSVFNTVGINSTPQNSGLALWTSSNSLSYTDKLIFDSGNGKLGINKPNPSFAIDIGGNNAYSNIRASGFIVGNSGIYFPSGNGGLSSYSGGRQLFHFEKNQIHSTASQVLDVSGIVNQNILFKKQAPNTFLAGPSGACIPPCNPDYPSFRQLVLEDIPDLSSLYSNAAGNNDPRVIIVSGMIIDASGALNSRITQVSGSIIETSGYFDTKFAQVDSKITSASGALNNRISTVQTYLEARITSASGALNNSITSASGALNNSITSASGALNNRITSASGALNNTIVYVSGYLNNLNINSINGGRLSLSSTDSTFDGSGTSLYFTPHQGNSISLYDGTSWKLNTFTGSLVSNFSSLLPNTIYDVFAYANGTNVNFELLSWNMYGPPPEDDPNGGNLNNSSRSVLLNKFQGVWCKSGNNTRRYIGTIRTGQSAFIDNKLNRFVCNHNNKIKKQIRSIVNLNDDPPFLFSWIYTSNVTRKIPYISQIEVVNGLDSEIDLKIVLDCQIPYVRSSYQVGIIRNPEIFIDNASGTSDEDILYYLNNEAYFYDYGLIALNGTDGQITSDLLDGDYQDGTQKTLIASIKCRPAGYEKYYGIETANGSPIVKGNNLLNTYGIMGTYEC